MNFSWCQTHLAAYNGLELLKILLPQPLESWNYKPVSTHPSPSGVSSGSFCLPCWASGSAVWFHTAEATLADQGEPPSRRPSQQCFPRFRSLHRTALLGSIPHQSIDVKGLFFPISRSIPTLSNPHLLSLSNFSGELQTISLLKSVWMGFQFQSCVHSRTFLTPTCWIWC